MNAFGVAGFEQPLWWLAAAGLAAVMLVRAWRTPPPALAWPAWSEIEAAGARHVDWVRGLASCLRAGALLALGAVLAGPVTERAAPPPPEVGLDVILVLDTSGSMRALDAEIDGEWRTRLDLARQVVRRFALERIAEGDRVGLVVFGETAFTQCPLTRDGRLLARALERVDAGMAGEATALGDALTLAVKRAVPATEGAVPAPRDGRVVVLLTDGRSNAGAVPADVAAGVARARGVRVHTVGIGSEGEVAMDRPQGAAGHGLRFERHDLDAATLSAVAQSSGGRFFRASGSEDLLAVYAEIDALERVPRRGALPPRRSPRPEPFLALAGALLLAEIGTARGLARSLP